MADERGEYPELTYEQRKRLDALNDEMAEDTARQTFDRWVTECVEYRRQCRSMGNEPTLSNFIRTDRHRVRARKAKLVMVALAAGLWDKAQEVEKRG